jgi:replicative DNA helicase
MDPHGTNNLAHLPGSEGAADRYREPPLNYEAEQALLGAILANNAAFERVADFLRPEHFAEPVHGRIFEACGTLVDRGQIANAVTLKNVFERSEELAEVGGAKYLSELQGNFVSIINARDYGRTVHDLFLRRQLTSSSWPQSRSRPPSSASTRSQKAARPKAASRTSRRQSSSRSR